MIVEAPPRPKPVDAGTPSECEAACQRYATLGCEEGEPTAEGVTCTAVCNRVEQTGTVTLNPGCVATTQLDSCTGEACCQQIEEHCSYGESR